MSDLNTWLRTLLEEEFEDAVNYSISTNLDSLNEKSVEEVCNNIANTIWDAKEMTDFRRRVAMYVKDKVEKNSGSLLDEKGMSVAASDTQSVTVLPSGDACTCLCDQDAKWNKTSFSKEKCNHSSSPNELICNQRIQALELLLRAPVGDLVYSTVWPNLQQELCESLCDDNTEVYHLVLRLHAKLISSSAVGPIREGFFSLIEGLTLYYLSRKTYPLLPTIYSGIHLNSNVHKQMIFITKCALEAISELPRKWVRFGEKRVQEILENFIDLLSMHTHSHRSSSSDKRGEVLYPFHLIAVLDPRATWCEAVSHAAFSRTILLKIIMKSNSLLQFILEETLLWLNSNINQSNGVVFVYDNYTLNVSGNMITLTVFMHCLSIIKMLISSDRGYSIFPIQTSLEQDPITVYGLVLRIMSFLNTHVSSKNAIYSRQTLETVEEAATALILSKGTKILSGKSSQLARLLGETSCNQVASLYMHNVNILNKISEVERGINWILGRPEKKIKDLIFRSVNDIRQSHPSSAPPSSKEINGPMYLSTCLAFILVDSTVSALRDRNILANSEDACVYVCKLLSLCGKIFGTIDGFLTLESYENYLVQEAGNLFIYLCENNFKHEGMKHNENLSSVCSSLGHFFMKLAMTPLGFVSVSNVDGLVNCLLVSHLQHQVKAWDSPQFMHFIELTSLINDETLNVYRSMLISQILNEFWLSIEDENKFMTMEKHIKQDIISQFLSRLICICSSPNVVSDLLTDTTGDDKSESSDGTLVEETQQSAEPVTLDALIRIGLQEADPLHVHHICLSSLHALAQFIDVSVVLLEKLNLNMQLAQLQQENSLCLQSTREKNVSTVSCDLQPSPRKDQVIVHDEHSFFRGHIMDVLSQVRDGCIFDVLNSPALRNMTSPRAQLRAARLRTQTDLQRFLQDTRLGLHDNMWLTHARRAYRMSCHNEIKVCVLLDLLEQVLRCQTSPPMLLSSWPSAAVKHTRTEYFEHAIQLIVRYGCQQRVLNSHMSAQYVEQLALLLDQARMFLPESKEKNCFDWFVASVFLMCSGNIDRSRSVLQRVAMLHTGPLLWHCLSQSSWQNTAALNHQLQGLIAEFLPQEYNNLQMDGIPWWHTMMRMTQQGFLTCFPISQLPHVVAFYALHPPDYILFLRTAILAHLKSRKPKTLRLGPYPCLVSEIHTDGFCISDLIPCVDRLAKLNRSSAGREKSVMSTL